MTLMLDKHGVDVIDFVQRDVNRLGLYGGIHEFMSVEMGLRIREVCN